jgi:hypothetical protein
MTDKLISDDTIKYLVKRSQRLQDKVAELSVKVKDYELKEQDLVHGSATFITLDGVKMSESVMPYLDAGFRPNKLTVIRPIKRSIEHVASFGGPHSRSVEDRRYRLDPYKMFPGDTSLGWLPALIYREIEE